MRDIYYIDSRFESQNKELKECVSKVDSGDWEFYEEYLVGLRIHKITILKQMFCFRVILDLYGRKNLKAIPEKEIIDLNYKVMSSQYAQSTKHDIQITLRRFLLLFTKTLKREHLIKKYIKVVPQPQPTAPKRLIQKQDLVKLLNGAPTDEMKMMIKVLYSTGMRITEIYNIKPSGIEEYDDALWINTKGKRTTGNKEGFYRYFMVFFVVEFKRYIQGFKPDEYVFNVSYPYFCRKLKEIVKEENMNLDIYPHLFRHTTATALFRRYPEQKVYKCMNWSANSKMSKVYCNMNDKDIVDTLEDFKKNTEK